MTFRPSEDNDVSRTPVEFLPHEIAKRSISRDQIMLPYREALSALATLDKDGHTILSCDPWVITREGQLTAAGADEPLSGLPRARALSAARESMTRAQQAWERSKHQGDELVFRIRVAA
jgi:hypothetical protein